MLLPMCILHAQQDSLASPEPMVSIDTSTNLPVDTIPIVSPNPSIDTVNVDSILISEKGRRAPGKEGQAGGPPEGRGSRPQAPTSNTTTYPEGGIVYGSKDSSITDLRLQLIHLYGDAYVRYDDFEVKADYIIFNLVTNEVEALSQPYQNQKPTFINGSQVVSADSIRYNIDSEKGIVYGARIQQDQFYIHGATTKFVRAGSDSLHIDDVIYNKNALLTTCDEDHPHWGIRTTKLKMIPEKLAVMGPFDMELGGIPTPLALPFAFAPLFNFAQGTTGIIFPERDPLVVDGDLGIGTRGIGYYFALSDRMDLKLTGDIYTRGTFSLSAESNYRKRYKHSGRVGLLYSREIQDVEGSLQPNIEKAYRVSINHRQDSKAHPYRTVGGSLNFTINDFDRRNYADAQSQLNSSINSNFSYAYRINSKTNFSASIQHSQNTRNRSISFTLPEMQLRVSRFHPFKRKKSSASKEKWFEKINVQYNGRFQNRVSTTDTLLFTSQTLEKFRFGFSQDLDVNASYKVFDFVSFNTSANYDEFNYFQTYRHEIVDSTGEVSGSIVNGLKTLRDVSVTANMSTNLFSTLQFAKGKLRGLRHKMTPTLGLSYSPSTLDEQRRITSTTYVDEDDLIYNPFQAQNGETLIFNRSLQRGGARITFGVDNTFEGKTWSKKDSIEKKFNIFNNVRLAGNYNLQADSLNWSVINLTANARLFNGKSTLSISGIWDPYVLENNRRVNKTTLSQNGKLFRWAGFTTSISTNMTFKDIRDLFRGDLKDDDQQSSSTDRTIGRGRSREKKKTGLEEPELFSWFEGARISHVLRVGLQTDSSGIQTIAHSIQMTTGNIPLSDKWGMSVGNISYDLKRGRWVYPSFSLTRDLHCWQMSISWQPQRDTYSFSIGVKAAPFSNYIRYQSGRNNFQGVNSFR